MGLIDIIVEEATIENGGTIIELRDIGARIIVKKLHRPTGQGASYVKEWEVLPPWHIEFLAWWTSSAYVDYWADKKTLRKQSGTKTLDSPWAARMSELVGLGLVEMSNRQDDEKHHTKVSPKYKVNLEAYAILKNNNFRLHTI